MNKKKKVLHHAKTGDIAYIYDIAIIYLYPDMTIGLWIKSDIGHIYSFIHLFIIDNTENYILNRDVRLASLRDVVEIP